jgi:hypothetical protein
MDACSGWKWSIGVRLRASAHRIDVIVANDDRARSECSTISSLTFATREKFANLRDAPCSRARAKLGGRGRQPAGYPAPPSGRRHRHYGRENVSQSDVGGIREAVKVDVRGGGPRGAWSALARRAARRKDAFHAGKTNQGQSDPMVCDAAP